MNHSARVGRLRTPRDRLGDDDGTRLAEPTHRRRVDVGAPVALRAVAGAWEAHDVDPVLDGDGHAVQRAGGCRAVTEELIAAAGRVERTVVVVPGDHVRRSIELVEARRSGGLRLHDLNPEGDSYAGYPFYDERSMMPFGRGLVFYALGSANEILVTCHWLCGTPYAMALMGLPVLQAIAVLPVLGLWSARGRLAKAWRPTTMVVMAVMAVTIVLAGVRASSHATPETLFDAAPQTVLPAGAASIELDELIVRRASSG